MDSICCSFRGPNQLPVRTQGTDPPRDRLKSFFSCSFSNLNYSPKSKINLFFQRSKSATSFYPGDRPSWAQTGNPGAPFVKKSVTDEIFDATVRPAPSTTTAQLAKAMKDPSIRNQPSKSPA